MQMPPSVVLIAAQQGHGQRRQQESRQQQGQKPPPGIGENRRRPAAKPGRYPGRADPAQQHNQRRRGDGKPDGIVMRRQFVRKNQPALEQLRINHRMIDRQIQARGQIVNGIGPSVGRGGVQSQPGRQDEHPAGHQDAPALRPTPGIKQVQPPHRQYRRKKHYPHNPQVGQQSYGYAQQRKGPDGIPAESPFQQI